MIDAPIISVTPTTEISVTPPTEIDVLIEVDVQVEERKVSPSRAIKRVLGTHVDETACPLEKSTITARVGHDRSKRLATTEAEAHEEKKKLVVAIRLRSNSTHQHLGDIGRVSRNRAIA